MAPEISRSAAEFILKAVIGASLEPWMELSDRLEEHYKVWGFQNRDLLIPEGLPVRDVWEAVHRFHIVHPEAYAEPVIFETSFIRIVRYNPLQQR